MINFAKGHPDPGFLPNALIAAGLQRTAAVLTGAAADQTLQKTLPTPPALLNYCAGRGAAIYRDRLARFITRQANDGCRAHSDSLLTVNGVSHGLSLIASVLAKPGDEVLVETPCYFLACDIFKHHHLSVVPLPLARSSHHHRPPPLPLDPPSPSSASSFSFCLEGLERTLNEHPKAKLLYLVPTHCNPTGHSLCDATRKGLVELCKARGVTVVADEVYHFLDWTAPPSGQQTSPSWCRPKRMVAHDPAFFLRPPPSTSKPPTGTHTQKKRKTGGVGAEGGEDEEECYRNARQGKSGSGGDDKEEEEGEGGDENGTVVSVSSFTKIAAPGLRLGWIEACPSVIKRLAAHGYVVSGGGVAPMAEEIVSALINDDDGDDDGGYGHDHRKHFPSALASSSLLPSLSSSSSSPPPSSSSSPARGTPLESYLTSLCAAYATKAKVLTKALRSHGFQVAAEPLGGFFIWVQLPPSCPLGALELVSVAEAKHGVSFLPGPRCQGSQDVGRAPLKGTTAATAAATQTQKDNNKDGHDDAADDNKGKGRGSGGAAGEPREEGGGNEDSACMDRWMRLCFATLSEAELVRGVEKLTAACADAKAEAPEVL